MTELSILYLLGFLLFLFFSAFFSGMETASISANRLKLKEMESKGDHRAHRLLMFLGDIHRVVVTCLVGNNLVLVLCSQLGRRFHQSLGPIGSVPLWGRLEGDELIELIVITFIILLFGELVPKQLARQEAEKVVHFFYLPLSLLARLFVPLVEALSAGCLLLLRPLGVERIGDSVALTKEEILSIVEEGMVAHEEKTSERHMIRGIFIMEKTLVREVMKPLVDLIAVRMGEATIKSVLELARRTGFSRFPVFRRRIVELEGYVDVYHILRSDYTDRRLEDFVLPAYYVPETKRADELLREFLDLKLPVAIVVDEFGGCSGWVTREDLLEEIVGEIEDEFDHQEPELRKISKNLFEVEPQIDIDELNARLGLELPKKGYETLGGLVYTYLGHIPEVGETVEVSGQALIRVVQMEHYKIELLQLELVKRHSHK